MHLVMFPYYTLELDSFKGHNLNTENIVGQAYAGASVVSMTVMSGGVNRDHSLLKKLSGTLVVKFSHLTFIVLHIN
jgi:hypothetical protein